jgi:chromosome partitioning protein
MSIWAVCNQKGGVAKTTTVLTMASLLAQRGESVLILDLDPHGSLTTYLGYDPDVIETSIYTLFQQLDDTPKGAIFNCLKKTSHDNILLLPASTAMATLDRQLGAQQGKGLIIRKTLSFLKNRFDHIFIDCPPMLGVLMINALAACDKLLIPVQTEFLSLKGLEHMLHTITMINHSRRFALPYYIVPTMHDESSSAARDCLSQIQREHGQSVWSEAIPVDIGFKEASKLGQTLPEYNPTSPGALAYDRLLSTLLMQNTPEVSHG